MVAGEAAAPAGAAAVAIAAAAEVVGEAGEAGRGVEGGDGVGADGAAGAAEGDEGAAAGVLVDVRQGEAVGVYERRAGPLATKVGAEGGGGGIGWRHGASLAEAATAALGRG